MSRLFLDLTPPEGFRSWRQYAVHASGPRIPGPLSLIQMNQFADQFGDYIIEFRLPRPYPRRLARDAAALLQGVVVAKTPDLTEYLRPYRALVERHLERNHGVKLPPGVVLARQYDYRPRREGKSNLALAQALRLGYSLPQIQSFASDVDFSSGAQTGRLPSNPPLITEVKRRGTVFVEADYSTIEPVIAGVNDWWNGWRPPGFPDLELTKRPGEVHDAPLPKTEPISPPRGGRST